ncbi:amino acid ABC transporter permease [Salininema proteolyticum]|uniref:Amino acid ABC transporter permease n=1 Tax=Salininema proteolyticum TaxID=1607685 RepID=A0ABV8TVK7_9ACTN
MDSKWSNAVAAEVWPYVLKGFLVVLQVAAIAGIIAFVLGLALAIAVQMLPNAWAKTVSGVMTFIRNTPILVQALLVWTFVSLYLPLNWSALGVGAVVLGVHYASYTMESFRAGIEAIPKGQWEAATALALPRTRTWLAVIGPQMFKRSLPAVTNWLVAMFKEVPILSAIGVAEMIFLIREYTTNEWTGFVEGYTLAGLLFLAASYPIAFASRRLEIRLEQSHR